ncbi:MAG: RHS repeat-associated core domain-containing protein, partial [Victivallales bacterium]|nr:RHS repeat-associated core domain-containing protein [Victivallales bacterium]
DPVNYLDLNGMAGQGTSLPTKHEEGSFLDNLANGKSATYVYDAFGDIIEQTGDITDNALTWHGHFETLLNPDGSYYVLARNYSATDGRFISTDPSFFSDGANLYTYAYNDPVNYLDLNGMAGQGTSLPTKHEEGSFLDNLANGKWLENLLPGLKDYDPTDSANQIKTNAPKIGTGDAPNEWFNAANAVVDKAVPSQYNKVSDYYKGGLNVAKTLYEKGCVSTKDGTVWPSRFATELDDRYMRHCFDRYQQATTQSGKEEFIRQAYIRYYDLQDQRKANNSKPKGGTNATSANTQSASSYDPNDKLSTAGATELHFVQNGSRLQYTVLFENDPDNATAPARKVYIRDVMDDNLDINTFQLHGFTLAGHAYQLPEGRDSFNGNVVLDLGDAEITVAVAINIDSETRELIASFTAIDPETGFELQNLTKGVLLVNDESGRGEGNLSYSIQALPDLPTDAQIHNTAEIFFDFNDPIETPTTLNTIDADAPGAASLVLSADAGQITLA